MKQNYTPSLCTCTRAILSRCLDFCLRPCRSLHVDSLDGEYQQKQNGRFKLCVNITKSNKHINLYFTIQTIRRYLHSLTTGLLGFGTKQLEGQRNLPTTKNRTTHFHFDPAIDRFDPLAQISDCLISDCCLLYFFLTCLLTFLFSCFLACFNCFNIFPYEK